MSPRPSAKERSKQKQLEDFSSLGENEPAEDHQDYDIICRLFTLILRNLATSSRHDPTQLPSPLKAEKGDRKLRSREREAGRELQAEEDSRATSQHESFRTQEDSELRTEGSLGVVGRD